MGWPASETRAASLAELWASWIGYARSRGWLRERPEAMTRDRLEELMEQFPDAA